MALNIKNQNVDRLARRSARLRRTTITEALEAALERDVVYLENEENRRRRELEALVRDIQAQAAAIPDRDSRPIKEMSDWLWDDSE